MKKNYKLKLETTTLSHNIYEILKLLAEERSSFTLDIVLENFGLIPREREMTVTSILKLAIKYPVLFYKLEDFKRICRRYLFGDKFWKNKRNLKLQHKAALGVVADLRGHFQSWQRAAAVSATALITDVMHTHTRTRTPATSLLSEELYAYDDVVHFVTREGAIRLKEVFGYKRTKRLIAESGLETSDEVLFTQGFEADDAPMEEKEGDGDGDGGESPLRDKKLEMTLLDKESDHHFSHDPASGETAWGQQLIAPDGSLFREIFLHCKR
jgi:hypothetical protein